MQNRVNMTSACIKKSEQHMHHISDFTAHLFEGASDLFDGGTIPDLQHLHCRGEGQCWQQLGGQQEALRSAWLAGAVHKLHEDLALVDGVHPLIDLINHTAWAASHILHQHVWRFLV